MAAPASLSVSPCPEEACELPIAWEGSGSAQLELEPGRRSQTALASLPAPPAGSSSWRIEVLELAEVATSFIEVGVALLGAGRSEDDVLMARYAGAPGGAQCCGVVRPGCAVQCRLDVDAGIFALVPVGCDGEPSAEAVEWSDSAGSAQAPLPGRGTIRGQRWVPYVRLRSNEGLVVRSSPLSFVPPDPEVQARNAASATSDLREFVSRAEAAGKVGPGMSEFQYVLEPNADGDGAGGLLISSGFPVNSNSLAQLGIGAVLRLGDWNYAVPEGVDTMTVNIGDSADTEIIPHVEAMVLFQQQHLAEGRNVLVHCGAGVSRSGAAAVAFVMWKRQLPYDEALAFVRGRRRYVRPNAGFAEQLRAFDFTAIQA